MAGALNGRDVAERADVDAHRARQSRLAAPAGAQEFQHRLRALRDHLRRRHFERIAVAMRLSTP